ncbi:phosphoribosylformylglycinamidine cyclo-ligase [Tissierella pigra]|uniref:Phosphoribosylformylglycinamidine cyclo-ligase n=1 Tax=Tissierella pigra TaxID=2607614 RepID=A0A6N7XSB8_9FIRM|nr:phosphoribosylformylglycinamidine cyclo-ligase [Tissierella pigra]MBU5427564.1 phosphoribosylformylglycinamidine cyclo-ligase [Tissierella pigra]MSU00313.1 phosphoribosylformylglycinamidine cyclo-ligase [Tissierella pigra]
MSLTYKDAGVDKEAGYKEVQLIKGMIKKTHIPGVLSDIGGFAGLFQLDTKSFEEPVLVSGTDGVGTKLRLAFMMDKHNTIGEDCVAMCANDILCQGAKPLFFLDYIATGKLIPEKMASIVEGVSNGCIKAQCALIGGETAEMPGFYKDEEYDVAGFCVGVVDKKKIINGSTIEEGDYILGLPSSGVHSNGFSLVRKIVFDKMNLNLDEYIEELGSTLGEELLKPTRIYTNPVYDLVQKFNVKGLSHITGGGFYENIPRMLPTELAVHINTTEINTPPIFNLLQKWGGVPLDEMYATFNMGIGMVMAVDKNELEGIGKFLEEKGEEFVILGEVKKGSEGVVLCHQ